MRVSGPLMWFRRRRRGCGCVSWDPFQRAVLAELGHELYRPVRLAVAGSIQVDDAVLARMARAAALGYR
jgi:hypothetical protein